MTEVVRLENMDVNRFIDALRHDRRVNELEDQLDEETAKKIYAEIFEKNKKYSFSTAKTRVLSTMKKRIASEQAGQYVGIIAGARDTTKYNVPVNFTLLRPASVGGNVEFYAWGGKVQYEDGSEETIPTGVAATVALEPDDRGRLKAVGLTEVKPLSRAKLIQALEKLGCVLDLDEVVQQKKYSPVCFRTRIERALASRNMDADEDEKNNTKKYKQILEMSEDGKPEPALTLQAEHTKKKTTAWMYMGGTRYAHAHVDIDDWKELLQEAVISSTDPTVQVRWLNDALQGREVIVVGSLMSVRDGDKPEFTACSANISVAGIYEITDDIEVKTQDTLPVKSEPIKEAPKEEPKEAPTETFEPDNNIEEMKKVIADRMLKYAESIGTTLNNVPVDALGKACKLSEFPPDVVGKVYEKLMAQRRIKWTK